MLAPVLARPSAVRRSLAALVLVIGPGAAVAGCGTFAQSYDPAGVDELTIPTPSPDAADFVSTVDNPWLAWKQGATRTYTVTGLGTAASTRTVTVLPGRVQVAGVATTAVRTTLGGGSARSVTTDYYAQDEHGNVWWFGHQDAAGSTGSTGSTGSAGDPSWRAGEGGAEAGLAMAAEPRRADGYRTAYLPGVVEDVATVVDVGERTLEIDVTTRLAPGGVVRETYRRGTGLVTRIDAVTGEMDELEP
jgi:hypothetical protein